ncbi:hypothetical protein EDC04DRAFT_2510752, partial [Pisolithus marmoratus]
PSQPMHITPESCHLFEAPVAGVLELCDAFKFIHLHQSQNLTNAGAGGITLSGIGAHTPAQTPGHPMLGQMSICQVPGHTPNPHGSQTPAPPPTYGGGIPSSSYKMPSQPHLGYETP